MRLLSKIKMSKNDAVMGPFPAPPPSRMIIYVTVRLYNINEKYLGTTTDRGMGKVASVSAPLCQKRR